ncbi:MAG TPA: hypothetical protein VNO50_16595 [Pyrinomonadaceae bacterium]|nr:hypothetical protein [Pyrinomonadaceae bacterium]
MALILKALAGISALVLLAITLFSSLIAVGGALITVIKFAIVAIFVAVIVLIVFSMLRDRSRRRREEVSF